MLKYCENKPRFLMDQGPLYNDVFRDLELSYAHETFGERSKVEAVLPSYKQRSRVYFNNFNLNFRAEPKRGDPAQWLKGAIQLANLFAVTFILYHNQLR
jgi:transposase-like protein